MAPDSETTSEKVQKSLSDLTLPEICSLNEDLHSPIKDSSLIDKGDKINGVPQSPVKKIAVDEKEEVEDDGIPIPVVQLYPPGQVCLEWSKVHKIGAGLANLGNTCFLNTVIQCLTYCPPLANYLLQGDHSANCKNFEFCMMCELQKHTRQVFQRSGDVIKPLCIYQNLKYIADHFQFGQQEDAHEFLRFVIDNLWRSSIYSHSNDKLDPASRETTVINHIFGGYNRSQVVCLQCNLKSDKYEHFMDLILDIQNAHSLEKAVEQFVKPELLENENAYKCPKCDKLVPAEKTFTIHRPPNVATFQLKRFHYYKSYGKITKHISYPESFDLRPYMSQRKGGSLLYKLNAVLVHMGQNCNSGHYYCYIRSSNGLWYLMDDAKVQKVSLHDVLNQQAYVLFYVRSSRNGIHFKNNAVSSVLDFPEIKITSPGNVVSLSSPMKSQSFQEASECADKSYENSSRSVPGSPLLSSEKTCHIGFRQPFKKSNAVLCNQQYNNDRSVNPRYSRALKLTNRKYPYTSDKYSSHKRLFGKARHRNFSVHCRNNSDDRSLVSQSGDSNFQLSPGFEKNSQDSGCGRVSSVVYAYDMHCNINYGTYGSDVERYENVNSVTKYQSSENCSNFFENNYLVSDKINVSGNQYLGRKSDFYSPDSFANNNYRMSDKSINPQNNSGRLYYKFNKEGYSFPRNNHISSDVQDNNLEYKRNICMNAYVPQQEGFRGFQNNEQFPFGHRRNIHETRNFHYKTSKIGGRDKFNEVNEHSSRYFPTGHERNADFRNGSAKNYDDVWAWKKEHSSFPNILKDCSSRIYQGKRKHSKHYFSCRMAHFASPSFSKFKGPHRPSPYHKCLNIC